MENTQNTQSTISDRLREKYELELMTGKYNTNHILHLILSVLTGGGWLFIWAIVAWRNDVSRTKAEEIVYGAGEPNYLTRTLGIGAFVMLVLAFFGFMATIGTVSENIENQQVQTQTQIERNISFGDDKVFNPDI
jgi:hypothetical protein